MLEEFSWIWPAHCARQQQTEAQTIAYAPAGTGNYYIFCHYSFFITISPAGPLTILADTGTICCINDVIAAISIFFKAVFHLVVVGKIFKIEGTDGLCRFCGIHYKSYNCRCGEKAGISSLHQDSQSVFFRHIRSFCRPYYFCSIR